MSDYGNRVAEGWIYIYAIINGKIWSIKKDLWVIVNEGD